MHTCPHLSINRLTVILLFRAYSFETPFGWTLSCFLFIPQINRWMKMRQCEWLLEQKCCTIRSSLQKPYRIHDEKVKSLEDKPCCIFIDCGHLNNNLHAFSIHWIPFDWILYWAFAPTFGSYFPHKAVQMYVCMRSISHFLSLFLSFLSLPLLFSFFLCNEP